MNVLVEYLAVCIIY